ncbi:unnamed protein product, partial [Allacma fusca]
PKVKYYSDRHQRRIVKAEAEILTLPVAQTVSVADPCTEYPVELNRNASNSSTIDLIHEQIPTTQENTFDSAYELQASDSTIPNSTDQDILTYQNNVTIWEEECQPITTSEDSDNQDDHFDIQNYLVQWSLKHKVSHSALNDLLTMLKKHECFTNIPKDSRTPRQTVVEPLPPGEYVHFGLKNALQTLLENVKNPPVEMKIQIGIDGIPVHRSTNIQMWPRLVRSVDRTSSMETVVADAVRCIRSTSDATDSEIKKAVMSWLQHSTDRVKAHLKALNKRSETSRQYRYDELLQIFIASLSFHYRLQRDSTLDIHHLAGDGSMQIRYKRSINSAVISAPTEVHTEAQSNTKISKPIYKPNDWLSDLIRLITGEDVTAFITLIHETISASEKLAVEVYKELIEILGTLEGEASRDIELILNSAIEDAIAICETVVIDLATLMPAITNYHPLFADVSELIKIILGKTLEQFLLEVGIALIKTQELIEDTVTKIEVAAEKVAHEAAVKIRALANKTLVEVANMIEPILRVLEECIDLDSTSKVSPKDKYLTEAKFKLRLILNRPQGD